jgi:hypothetical protein
VKHRSHPLDLTAVMRKVDDQKRRSRNPREADRSLAHPCLFTDWFPEVFETVAQ